MTGLLHHFAAAAARHPERIAIVDAKGRETRFADLKTRADGLAARWQAQGISHGDRVLMARHVDADLYASLAALWSLGAVAVLPEPAMGLAGLRHAIRTTRPKAVCASGGFRALRLLPELWGTRLLSNAALPAGHITPAATDADIALISFTSGSTGNPKAIPRSHNFLLAQHAAIAPLLHSSQPQRDLVAFPVFTLINIADGQTSVLPNWKMSRLDETSPQALHDWMTRQRISRALIPPSLCEKLASTDMPADLGTIFTGGGPVFPDLITRLTSVSGATDVICVYGSTEAEPIAHLDARDITAADFAAMAAGDGLLVGSPVPDLQLRIRQDEIQVAGRHVNPGYLDPDDNAENKLAEGDLIWHRTGDAGRLDKAGRLWLLGRIGSRVTIGGKALYPFQIEVAARQWRGVTQAGLVANGQIPVLALAGDVDCFPHWQEAAAKLGISEVRRFDRLPTDRRHASKIDIKALRKLI